MTLLEDYNTFNYFKTLIDLENKYKLAHEKYIRHTLYPAPNDTENLEALYEKMIDAYAIMCTQKVWMIKILRERNYNVFESLDLLRKEFGGCSPLGSPHSGKMKDSHHRKED